MTRPAVLLMLTLAGGASMAWGQSQPTAALPSPDPANFTGKVTAHPTTDIRTLRYSFEPGARTNWHSHAGGQVVMIEQGRARVQEAGGAVRELGPRDVFTTAPGVRHWHGAVPKESLTQVAVSFGATTWGEKVTDDQYAAGTRK
jgi:quercetin dioxygenase-like cupin family protein